MSVLENVPTRRPASLKREIGLIGLLWASTGSIIGSGWLFSAQKGLVAPQEETAQKKPVSLFESESEIEAYMSAVDGGGGRLIWIAKPQPSDERKAHHRVIVEAQRREQPPLLLRAQHMLALARLLQ